MSQVPSNVIRDLGLSIVPFLDGAESPILSNVLIRGPVLAKRTYEQLGRPKTIINLRMGNKSNVYDTQSNDVRKWLADVFRLFESPVDLPVLIHCKHGRDRTGVAVAVLLMILGVPRNAIMGEFLLTDGAEARDLMRTFAGIKERGGIENYFEGMLDLEAIRGHLSWPHVKEMRRQLFKKAAVAIRRKEDPTSSCQLLLESCERGLNLMADDAEMYAGLGWALARLGRYREANHAFAKGLRLAAGGNVKNAVVEMMMSEMKALQSDGSLDELCNGRKQLKN